MSENSPPPASLSAEKKAGLVKNLFAEILEAVKVRDFRRADALRDKLVEVDPMALSEIIKANGIIEEEKTAAFDRDHLAIWDKLYDSLSEEERNCLFYSMNKLVVPAKKLLLSHGTINNRLFLIDKGQVTIFFPKDGQNIVLGQLGRGEILGEDTFASISLCSASAATYSEVQVMCLESKATEGWEDKYPGLYVKLVDFCIKNGRTDELIRSKNIEKRKHVRHLTDGVVSAILLTSEGQKTDIVFRGSLSDISIAGACFTIRCSKKATAKALLGRHLLLSFSCGIKSAPVTFQNIGRVVRVSSHLYDDYSVHSQFSKHISEDLLRKIAPEGE